MHRRTTLLLGASLAGTALSGCLGGTTDDDGGDANGQAAFDDAIEYLLDNAAQLDDLSDSSASRDEDDVSELRGRLDDATAALDDADGSGSDEKIEAARTVATFQEKLIEAHDLGIQTETAYDEAETYDDNEEDELAVEKYEDALDLIDDQRDLYEDLGEAHEAVDADVLDEPDLAYDDDIYEYVRVDDPVEFDHFESFITGRRDLAQGWLHLGTGDGMWHAQQWEHAEDEWESGLTVAQRALVEFDDLAADSSVDGTVQTGANMLGGITEMAISMFEKLIVAAQYAQDGADDEAESKYEEGMAQLFG